MLRPEPRPEPSASSAIRTTGPVWRSAIREATIPTTPGVPALAGEHQPGGIAELQRAARRGTRSAAASTSRSTSRRSWLARSSSAAISSARASSAVSISSTPASARYRRPAALIRGPSRKARSPSSRRSGRSAPPRISARSPGRRAWRATSRPRAHERAVLASQRDEVGDRGQRDEVEVGLGRSAPRAAPRRACRRPRSRTARRTDSRRGAGCRIGQSGSRSPGWW